MNELKSSQNTYKLSRKLNVSNIIISLLTLSGGIAVLFATTNYLQLWPTLQMIFVVVGFFFITYTLFLWFARSRQWVYEPTSSPVVANNIYLKDSEAKSLGEELRNNKVSLLSNLHPIDTSNHYLEAVTAKDHQFVALQLMQLSTFKYEPSSPIYTFSGDKAKEIAGCINCKTR